MPADVFRAHVVADARVSDTILEAFLARRALLLASAADTLLIVGSEFSPESMALREYAARNRLPHRWIDADVQSDVATLLDGLGVTAAELPIAIIAEGVLRRATPGRAGARSWGSPSTPCPSGASTSWSSAPARPGWRRRSTPRPRGCAR